MMKTITIAFVAVLFLVAGCATPEPEPVPLAEPEPAPEPVQEAAPEPEPEPEPEGPVIPGTQITILGETGFDPQELTISAGETVSWVNKDTKDADLTVFKDGRHYENSPVIEVDGFFSLTLDEAAEYTYWTIGYGPKGAKITVE